MTPRSWICANDLGRHIELRVGDAEALEMPSATFDTVVCTFSLCAIPDHRKALAEMTRVLRPGGVLLLADHVASSGRVLRAGQRVLELPPGEAGGPQHRECWFRDLDGYTVVLASPTVRPL